MDSIVDHMDRIVDQLSKNPRHLRFFYHSYPILLRTFGLHLYLHVHVKFIYDDIQKQIHVYKKICMEMVFLIEFICLKMQEAMYPDLKFYLW